MLESGQVPIDKTAERRDYWRMVSTFLLLLLAGLAVHLALRWYDYSQQEKHIRDLAEVLKQEQAADYAAAMADTYGGQTPQETLQMYIDAVEKGDYELASKYFIGDKQNEWKTQLILIRDSGKLTEFLEPLKESMKAEGEFSLDKTTFSIHSPVLISFKIYPNGVWKIIEI